MTRWGLALVLAAPALLGGLAHCGHGPAPDARLDARPSSASFQPTRFDYASFRAGRAPLPEPNYLPFMAHRFTLAGRGEDVLVLCRWADAHFPLTVAVEPPEIPEDLQNEFDPRSPALYVAAVERALASWEEALPGVVRFERVATGQPARLRIRLVGEVGPSPQPEVQVLGLAPVARACRVQGGDPGSGRLHVTFDVPAIEIFVADRFGLLREDQVERLALHEMGHALGMRGHSPIPADLMYEQARDRTVDRLSQEDVNSFLALYALPNGTLYARLPHGRVSERPPARAPPGPRLDPAGHRDARLGYSVRLPEGWLRIPTRQGIVVVDGVAWDSDASLQVIVRRYRSIARYLELHLPAHIGSGSVVRQDDLRVADRPAFQVVVAKRGGSLVEQHTFVETGDGRVVVVIADAPAELFEGFEPWFDAVLGSLALSAPAGRASPSDTGGE